MFGKICEINTFFGLRTKSLRKCCQTCLVRAQKNILVIYKNSNFFGRRVKNFHTLSKAFSAGLSRLDSTCALEHFRKKLGKIENINFSGLWAETFQHSCLNCILLVQKNNSIKKNKKRSSSAIFCNKICSMGLSELTDCL